MPRGKRLKSFRELCLLNVIQNIDDLWCRHYIETYSKENRFFRYVVGPFDTVRKLANIFLPKVANLIMYPSIDCSFKCSLRTNNNSQRGKSTETTPSGVAHHNTASHFRPLKSN